MPEMLESQLHLWWYRYGGFGGVIPSVLLATASLLLFKRCHGLGRWLVVVGALVAVALVGFRLIALHPEFGFLRHLYVSKDLEAQKLYLRINDGLSIISLATSLVFAVGLLMMAVRKQPYGATR